MEGWWNRRWKGRERRENTGRKGRTRGEHGENEKRGPCRSAWSGVRRPPVGGACKYRNVLCCGSSLRGIL